MSTTSSCCPFSHRCAQAVTMRSRCGNALTVKNHPAISNTHAYGVPPSRLMHNAPGLALPTIQTSQQAQARFAPAHAQDFAAAAWRCWWHCPWHHCFCSDGSHNPCQVPLPSPHARCLIRLTPVIFSGYALGATVVQHWCNFLGEPRIHVFYRCKMQLRMCWGRDGDCAAYSWQLQTHAARGG